MTYIGHYEQITVINVTVGQLKPCRIKNSSSIKAVDGVALNSQIAIYYLAHLHHNYTNMNYSAINQTSTNPDTSILSNIMSNKSQLPPTTTDCPPPPLVSQVSICNTDSMTLAQKNIKSPPPIATRNRTRSQDDNTGITSVSEKPRSMSYLELSNRLDMAAARRQQKLKRRNSIEHQQSTRRSQRRRVTVDSSTDSDAILNSLVSTTSRKTEQRQLKPRQIHELSSSISTSTSSNDTVSDDTSIVDLVSSFSDSISIKDELAATNLAYMDELASELDFVWDQNEITMLQFDPTKKK